ncbi:MAG TPA: hypothetical protein VJ654_01000 [Noviherbaspirillum sp.]|nr:hypothetical protein [Noviherbaspirillum sp.]
MTLDEILTDLNAINSDALYGQEDFEHLNSEQVLSLMNGAAIQGFRMGNNAAMSLVKGALLVRLTGAINKGVRSGNNFPDET